MTSSIGTSGFYRRRPLQHQQGGIAHGVCRQCQAKGLVRDASILHGTSPAGRLRRFKGLPARAHRKAGHARNGRAVFARLRDDSSRCLCWPTSTFARFSPRREASTIRALPGARAFDNAGRVCGGGRPRVLRRDGVTDPVLMLVGLAKGFEAAEGYTVRAFQRQERPTGWAYPYAEGCSFGALTGLLIWRFLACHGRRRACRGVYAGAVFLRPARRARFRADSPRVDPAYRHTWRACVFRSDLCCSLSLNRICSISSRPSELDTLGYFAAAAYIVTTGSLAVSAGQSTTQGSPSFCGGISAVLQGFCAACSFSPPSWAFACSAAPLSAGIYSAAVQPRIRRIPACSRL